MKKLIVLASALALMTGPALALPTCEEAGIGIEDLVAPFDPNEIGLLDGSVSVRLVDTVEPACCSIGLAIITPVPDSESGDSECHALLNYRGLSMDKAKIEDSFETGAYLEIPTGGTNEDEEPKEGRLLKLRIMPETFEIKVEK